MNQVIPVRTSEPLRPRDYSPQQLALIRRTVAADCNPDEFDLFIEVAKRIGLDPFRRQIYAVVYSKDDEKKRKMSIITGIDGFRAVAARNRDYRPDDEEPVYDIDEAEKSDENPLGMRKAVVKAYKLSPDMQWHPVVGVAFWSEFAPIKEEAESYEWVETGEVWKDSGKPKKKRVAVGDVHRVPSGKWATMPHVMLSKCAEAQALKRGWPEDLSGVYIPEEMDQATMVDVTPSAAADAHDADKRLALVHAKNTVPILWRAGEPIELIPVGQMADRCLEFIGKSESVVELEKWRDVNSAGLREFWAYTKSEALVIKKAIEEKIERLSLALPGDLTKPQDKEPALMI